MTQSPARRPAGVSRPPQSPRRPGPARVTGGRSGPGRPPGARAVSNGPASRAEHDILFQKYFKSVGPRTYAAQLKRASNGNHYLVLTEGKRDESSGEVRKTRLFFFSEDFVELFKMLQATAQFIKANPVPDEVKKKRDRYWAKKGSEPAIRPRSDLGAPPTLD